MARAAVLPPSPAKRGTRMVPLSTATKTTASSQAKAVAEPKRRGVTKTTTTRKNTTAKADLDSDDTEDELGMMMKEQDEKPARPRGRPPARSTTKASTASSSKPASTTTTRGKKATPTHAQQDPHPDSDEGVETSNAEPPKRRAGRPRKNTVPGTSTADKTETAPKPRGRPKGSTTTSKTTATTRKNTRTVPEPEAATENALTRHIRIATKSTTTRSNILRGPAKKKTVTFEEPSDSGSDELEELSAPAAGLKKASAKATSKTGLGATPMRKTTGTAARGRKPATAKDGAAKPLSPKKDKQVAKSLASYASSDGEEDELTSAKYDFKSPVKLVVHSPVKPGTEITGLSSPVRRINFTPKKASNLVDENGEPKPSTPKNGSSATGLSSPVRKINFTPMRNHNTVAESGHLALPPGKSVDFSDSAFMSSPARRPEPSPFQFSLRDMPNRGLLVRHDANSAADAKLGSGPASPLKMSPKKANLGASFCQSPAKASPPFSGKTSLIQSPPKRIPSPFKGPIIASKDSINAVPALDIDDTTTVLPVPEAKEPPAVDSANEEQAVDDDMEMVEEVARDIFGIELQCYARSSYGSPSPQEQPASEEPLELEPAEDSFHEPEDELEAAESYVEAIDVDEKLHELQEEIRREPEDFGTICFNTMEELQKPFQNLPEDPSLDHNVIMNDIDDMMEMEEEEEGDDNELSVVPDVQPEVVEEMETPDNEPEAQSPAPSELTLGLAALEDAQSPIPSPALLDEYINIARQAHEGTDKNGVKEAGNENRYVRNDESASEEDQATVDLSSAPETPRKVHQAEAIESPQRSARSIPPLAPTPHTRDLTTFGHDSAKSKDWLFDIHVNPRMPAEDMDITQTEFPSPTSHAVCDTPDFGGKRKSLVNADVGFTPLASKMDNWETNTPSEAKPTRPRRRGVFSLVGPLEKPASPSTPAEEVVSYPDLSRTPRTDSPSLPAELPVQVKSNDATTPPPQSPHTPETSATQQGYSAVYSPIRLDIFEDPDISDPEELVPEPQQFNEDMNAPEPTEVQDECSLSDDDDKENSHSPVILPATPIRGTIDHLRTVHTISKVPLKGEGEVSPLKLPRKRGHSLESRSPTRSSPRVRRPVILPGNETVPTFSPHKASREARSPSPKRRCSTPRRSIGVQHVIQVPQSPLVTSSPGKTPRRKSIISQQTLCGAVVYVDVHTTEGEDASGIFVELLQQMGARCFRSWSWNPRSSMSPVDGVDPKESKVGITHVVYKDGGLRTLEKVKHAGGLVKCVGVGWVLDCERENKWLDEAPYMVDSSIIPRGGAKRRKSMEPRALSNVNGTLVRVAEPSTPSASGRRCGADRVAVEGFRKITPPTPLIGVPSTPVQQSDRYQVPATPGYNFANLDAIGMSPATPYFLSNRAKLVQQTCPPKQSNRGLFGEVDKPIFSLELDDEVETRRQQRALMEAARRKSHFFKPSVESPLGK